MQNIFYIDVTCQSLREYSYKVESPGIRTSVIGTYKNSNKIQIWYLFLPRLLKFSSDAFLVDMSD